MYEVAMFFSITSSVLCCIYLLMCIFGSNKVQDNTITIRGQFVTRTVYDAAPSNTIIVNRTLEQRN
jgi:hypothetical protein